MPKKARKVYGLESEENGDPLLAKPGGAQFFGSPSIFKDCRRVAYTSKAQAVKLARKYGARVTDIRYRG